MICLEGAGTFFQALGSRVQVWGYGGLGCWVWEFKVYLAPEVCRNMVCFTVFRVLGLPILGDPGRARVRALWVTGFVFKSHSSTLISLCVASPGLIYFHRAPGPGRSWNMMPAREEPERPVSVGLCPS